MAEWAVVSSKSKKKPTGSSQPPVKAPYVLPTGHNPLGTKHELCRYFALGTCSKGDTCHFSHNTKPGRGVYPAAPATAATGDSRSAALTPVTATVLHSTVTAVSTAAMSAAHAMTSAPSDSATPAVVGHSKPTHTSSTSEMSKLSATAAPWVPAPASASASASAPVLVPSLLSVPVPVPAAVDSDDLDDDEFYFYGAPGMAPSTSSQPPSLSSFDYPPLAGSLESFGPRFFNSALSTQPTTGPLAAAEDEHVLPEPSASPLRWLDDMDSPTAVQAQVNHEGSTADPSDSSLNSVFRGASNSFGGHGVMIRPKPTATMAAATASTAATAIATKTTAAVTPSTLSFAQIAAMRLTGPATVVAATVLVQEPTVVQVRKVCPFFRQGNCHFGKGTSIAMGGFFFFVFFVLVDAFR
jgi:hypothetical protein